MRVIAIVVLLLVLPEWSEAATRPRAVSHPVQSGPSPVAAADSYSLGEGTTLTIAAPGVLTNDTLNGATIASVGASTGAEQTTLGVSTQTAHGGSLTLSADGGFTYTAASAFSGTDTFRYILRNGAGTSSAAVSIVVAASVAAAVDDTYTTEPEAGFSIPAPGVLTNDTLAGGRIVSFGPTTGREHTTIPGTTVSGAGGTVTLGADGGFSYSPPPPSDDGYGNVRAFLGLDNFRYVIQRDAHTSTAVVNVSVQVPAAGADYVVTTPGHYYAISGLPGENPVLELTRGRTYKFRINVSPVHPFAILDAPPGSVTNNNITDGTLTFTVPSTAQNYRYRCTTHGFGNAITTVP